MTPTTLSLVLAALVAGWLLWSYLVGREVQKGERLLFSGARGHLDSGVERARLTLKAVLDYVDRHVIRLSWYYSLHSVLQAALRIVVSLYDYLEQRFHLNRKRARALRAERRAMKQGQPVVPVTVDAHLTSIAEHKAETALSPKQKQKLKTKKLERE